MSIFRKLFGEKNDKSNKKFGDINQNVGMASQNSTTTTVDMSSPSKKNEQSTDNVPMTLQDSQALASVFETLQSHHDTNDSAEARLVGILSQPAPHDNSDEILASLKQCALSQNIYHNLAMRAHALAVREYSLSQITDSTVFADIVANSEDIDTQSAAIIYLDDADLLRQLVKRYQGKKKKLYRAAKEQLAELKSRQQYVDELAEQFQAMHDASSAQTLSMTAILQAEKQLASIGKALNAGQVSDYQTQLDNLREQARAIESAKNARQQIITALAKLSDALESDSYAGERDTFNDEMNAWQQAWLATPEWTAAEAKGLAIRFEQQISQTNNHASQFFARRDAVRVQTTLIAQCQAWLDNQTAVTEAMRSQCESDWQASNSITPADAENTAKFKSLMAQLRERDQHAPDVSPKANHSATDDNAQAQLTQLIDALEVALTEGEVSKAQKLHRKITTQFKQQTGGKQFKNDALQSRFKQLNFQLNELKGWQHFGDDHVRQELLNEMQALADNTTMDVLDKADQVQAIQSRWKALQGHAPQALWEQFQQVANIAWAPCGEYFNAQRQLAQSQLEERLAFLAETEENLAKIDWHHPNWKAIGEAHKKFENAWRAFPKLPDVEYHKARKAYQKVVKPWEVQMDKERQREKQRRENLIKQVEALRDDENILEALETVKALQQQWAPTIGLRRRRDEQALWKRFKSACDAIFDKGNEQREAQKQQANSVFEGYQQQLDDLQALLDNASDFDDMKRAFDEANEHLSPFEGATGKGLYALRNRFSELNARFQNYQHEMLLDKRLDYLAQLSDQDMLCIQLERSMLNPERLETLSNKFQSLDVLLTDGQAQMKKRFEHAVEMQQQGSVIGEDLEDAIAEAQEICLLLEQAADLPSPDFAQKAREALRLRILDAAMNGDKSFGSYTTEAGLYEITVRWRVLPKGGFNQQNSGASLLDWRARFDNNIRQVRAQNALKEMREGHLTEV